MLPDIVTVTICNNCDKYFWVDEANIIDEVEPSEEKYSELEYLKDLTLERYIDALDEIEIRNEEDTFYLMLHIWWKYNDYFREDNQKELSENIKKEVHSLLNKLLDIFDESNDNQLMMKGELLRELGQFAEAKKTLNKITTPEYSKAKKYIKDLVQKRISELRELKI